MNALLVPSAEVSLGYFILDQLTYAMKHDKELNKNFRVVGPQGTHKTVLLQTFLQRSQDKLDPITVPMSSYLTFDRLRKVVEGKYVALRKKKFVPKQDNKKVCLIIDDIHLQTNLKFNLIEFIRTWCMSNGYFDVGASQFKFIQDFCVVMAESSDYRRTRCQLEGRKPLSNRFLFYSNTQYIDEVPVDKFKNYL